MRSCRTFSTLKTCMPFRWVETHRCDMPCLQHLEIGNFTSIALIQNGI